MARTVDLKNFAKEIGAFNKKHITELKAAAARGIAKSIPDLVKASPIDTGLYAQSWDMTVNEESIILGNYAPYAGIIEDGARPFKPPIGPLLRWAKRVLGDSSQPSETQTLVDNPTANGEKYSSRVWALALHTQRRIEERGMVPRHIMANALPGILENIKQEMLSDE